MNLPQSLSLPTFSSSSRCLIWYKVPAPSFKIRALPISPGSSSTTSPYLPFFSKQLSGFSLTLSRPALTSLSQPLTRWLLMCHLFREAVPFLYQVIDLFIFWTRLEVSWCQEWVWVCHCVHQHLLQGLAKSSSWVNVC